MHHAPPMHLHQASVITVNFKICSTCYVPLHLLQGFKEISETVFSWHGSLSKRGNSKRRQFKVTVLVFCKLYHGDIHLPNVSRKYLEQSKLNYIIEITIFKVQRAITPKVR